MSDSRCAAGELVESDWHGIECVVVVQAVDGRLYDGIRQPHSPFQRHVERQTVGAAMSHSRKRLLRYYTLHTPIRTFFSQQGWF